MQDPPNSLRPKKLSRTDILFLREEEEMGREAMALLLDEGEKAETLAVVRAAVRRRRD